MSSDIIAMAEKRLSSIENRIGRIEKRIVDPKRIEGLEESIKGLEKRVGELEKSVKETRDFMYKISGAIGFNSDLWSRYRYLDSIMPNIRKELFLDYMKGLLSSEKRFIDEHPDFKKWATEESKSRMSSYLWMIDQKKVKFDEFCDLVIRNLGRALAQELIGVEDIVKLYGSENARRWKEL